MHFRVYFSAFPFSGHLCLPARVPAVPTDQTARACRPAVVPFHSSRLDHFPARHRPRRNVTTCPGFLIRARVRSEADNPMTCKLFSLFGHVRLQVRSRIPGSPPGNLRSVEGGWVRRPGPPLQCSLPPYRPALGASTHRGAHRHPDTRACIAI